MILAKSGNLVGLVIALRFRHFMGPAETVTTERSCDDEPRLLQSDMTGDPRGRVLCASSAFSRVQPFSKNVTIQMVTVLAASII